MLGENFEDQEEAGIETRVSRDQAMGILAQWQHLLRQWEMEEGRECSELFATENDNTGEGLTESLVGNRKEHPDLTKLKDKLFIQSGEDTFDTFLAFKHYNLGWKELN